MLFQLRDRTVLLTIAGSRAYGLHTPDSDVDVKGICIPPVRECYLGILNAFEQADSSLHLRELLPLLTEDEQEAVRRYCLPKGRIVAPEGAVYDIRKFFKLALNANPNILEVVWAPDSHVRLETEEGRRLRENRSLFLSKKVAWSYQGYAYSQLRRIRTHRSWLLDPPKAPPISAPEVPMLTLAIPQSDPMAERKVSATLRDSVKMDEERPCRTPLFTAMASAKSSTSMMYRIGAKVSSWTMGASFPILTMVGSTK